jgi:hypothetical protein
MIPRDELKVAGTLLLASVRRAVHRIADAFGEGPAGLLRDAVEEFADSLEKL